jgi:endoglucanase
MTGSDIGASGTASDTTSASPLLRVAGNQLVDGEGAVVKLRGVGLGGWMNMESFITGYAGTESAQRAALHDVLGDELYELLFERFLTGFFGEADARFLHEIGLNCLRLPINYRHFERDDAPFTLTTDAFHQLDRVIEVCARAGVYTVIDLHAAQGFQNQDWHCDNPTHHAFLWDDPHFQKRAIWLWEELARHYRGNEWVAGYNLLNEPGRPEGGEDVALLYRRLHDAIRPIDRDHVLVLDGNRYSQDFEGFGEPLPNSVYSIHHYPALGYLMTGSYPGIADGQESSAATTEAAFRAMTTYMREHDLPIWVGECGPVYVGEPTADEMRRQLLRDQLAVYERHGASWSTWTWKDIGVQGVLRCAPDSPWLTRLRPFLGKKARLGADFWGASDRGIRDVVGPVEALMGREFHDYQPFPFGVRHLISRLLRGLLISEALVAEFAECFRGVTAADIEALVSSFDFENCIQDSELVAVLRESAA